MVTRAAVADPRSRYDGMAMPVEEYLALPEEKPYLEYVCGRVVQKMSPRLSHSDVVIAIIGALQGYAARARGKVGTEVRVVFETTAGQEFRLPDVAYWVLGRPLGGPEIALSPTLAVEVRSPDESIASQREKCRFYRDHGIDVCWLVDPGRRVVERFEGAAVAVRVPVGGALESAHLPGFRLALSELFAVLDA